MRTILLCVVLVACGGKKDGDKPAGDTDKPKAAEPTHGHCMLLDPNGKPDQRCWELDTIQAARAMCDSSTRKLVENQSCPKTGLLASCRMSSMLVRFYGGERGDCSSCPDGKTPAWTIESVARECKELGGKVE